MDKEETRKREEGEGGEGDSPSISSSSSTMTEEDFFLQSQQCVQHNTIMDLTGHTVTLHTTVKLPRGASLSIRGGVITGVAHSIFSMGTDRGYDNGPPALTLNGTTLLHTLTSEDKRAVGAAVFVMGKARIVINSCVIDSIGGFGVWVKHGGRVDITDTTILRAGRSVLACFNDARVTIADSTLCNAAVHGVCVRGDAMVVMKRCHLNACGTRAAFVYQRGSLTLEDCEVSGTGNCNTPAIQAESVAPSDDSKLTLRRCSVKGNEGPSLVINGAVTYVLEENEYSDEVEINPDVTIATVPRPWTELENEMKPK